MFKTKTSGKLCNAVDIGTSNYCYFWLLYIQKVFTVAEYFATDGVSTYTTACGIDIRLTCVLGFLLTESKLRWLHGVHFKCSYVETSTRGLKEAK